MTARVIRIFISSPGDVAEERVLALRTIERLHAEFAPWFTLEPCLWEHEPLLATATPQHQIIPPSQCDIVVTILWSRLGTALATSLARPDGSPYGSGTEYEFEDALAAARQTGVPDLLVYRKTAKPLFEIDVADDRLETQMLERFRQRRALESFIERHFQDPDAGTFTAAYHPFEHSGQFEELLHHHLRKLLQRQLDANTPTAEHPAAATWTGESPFRGLEVFERHHAPIFFGRTRAIGEVLRALREQWAHGRGFLLICGASGAGKSSLLRAGVIPLLAEPGVIEGVRSWRTALFRPADHPAGPLTALAEALVAPDALPELITEGLTAARLRALLDTDPAALAPHLMRALSSAAPGGARLILAVDQLEEIFTLEQVTDEVRLAFAHALAALATSGLVAVLATLRSDFFPRLQELPSLTDLRQGAGLYDLAPPNSAELGQMIREPALAAGLRFERDDSTGEPLDELLRDAAAREPSALPLLEFVLEELYRLRTPDGRLTLRAYHELGELAGAIGKRAEIIFHRCSPEERAAFPEVCEALATVAQGESEAFVRRRALLDDPSRSPAATRLIQTFIEARLLIADQEPGTGPVVMIAHEALLSRWSRMRDELESHRELLRIRARIETAVARWEAEGRHRDFLLPPGRPLLDAQCLDASHGFTPGSPAYQFVRASNNAERRRSATRGAAVIFFIALLGLACLSIASTRSARGDAAEAEYLSRLAGVDLEIEQGLGIATEAKLTQLPALAEAAGLNADSLQFSRWKAAVFSTSPLGTATTSVEGWGTLGPAPRAPYLTWDPTNPDASPGCFDPRTLRWLEPQECDPDSSQIPPVDAGWRTISESDQFLATQNEAGPIQILARDSSRLIATVTGADPRVAVQFSDLGLIAIMFELIDQSAVWATKVDLRTGSVSPRRQLAGPLDQGHRREWIGGFTLSRDGAWIMAVADRGFEVRVWHTTDWVERRFKTVGSPSAILVSRGPSEFFIGYNDGLVERWKIGAVVEHDELFRGTARVYHLLTNQPGTALYMMFVDETAGALDLVTGNETWHAQGWPVSNAVPTVLKGDVLATSDGGTLKFWQTQPAGSFLSGRVRGTSNGGRLLWGVARAQQRELVLTLWDAVTGKTLARGGDAASWPPETSTHSTDGGTSVFGWGAGRWTLVDWATESSKSIELPEGSPIERARIILSGNGEFLTTLTENSEMTALRGWQVGTQGPEAGPPSITVDRLRRVIQIPGSSRLLLQRGLDGTVLNLFSPAANRLLTTPALKLPDRRAMADNLMVLDSSFGGSSLLILDQFDHSLLSVDPSSGATTARFPIPPSLRLHEETDYSVLGDNILDRSGSRQFVFQLGVDGPVGSMPPGWELHPTPTGWLGLYWDQALEQTRVCTPEIGSVLDPEARRSRSLAIGKVDATSLESMADYYCARRLWSWAAGLYGEAQALGALDTNQLNYARCLWMTGDLPAARAHFTTALETAKDDDERLYLQLCLDAVTREMQPSASPLHESPREGGPGG